MGEKNDKNNFGFKIEGDWEEIVKKGKKIKESLEDKNRKEEAEEWEKWRPKENEEYEKEIIKKSVEKSIGDKKPKENKQEADEKIKQTKKDYKQIKILFTRIIKRHTSILNNLFMFTKSKSLELFKKIERFIYKNITAKYNPKYYEDEKLVSSIEKKSKIHNLKKQEEEYKMSINFEDSKTNKKLEEEVKED